MWCMKDDDKRIYVKCEKCNANYKLSQGRFSERNSCRCHKWLPDGFCRDCGTSGEYKSNGRYYTNQNCYHISRESLCIIL